MSRNTCDGSPLTVKGVQYTTNDAAHDSQHGFNIFLALSISLGYILLLLLLSFHIDYLCTRFLLADFHMTPILIGTDVTSIRELHYSSLIYYSSYGLPDRSVLLASNTWNPLILYHNNVTDADSG